MNRNLLIAMAAGLVLVAGLVWFLPRGGPQTQTPSELVFRTESFAINLFPPSIAEINSRRIGTLLHAPLVRLRDGRLEEGVASSWNDGGLVWRFRIREGATFSDGRPIGPEDAAASLCRSMQPSSSWSWSLRSIAQSARGEVVTCDGLSVEGAELVVRQTFDAPWLEEALSGPAGWVIPADADRGGEYGVVPGAGRYRVAEIIADSHVLLTPVDERAGLVPVRFRYLPDDSQAAALFREGQLAMLYLQSPMLKAMVAEGRGRVDVRERDFDRIRILIINQRRLAERGFSPEQIRAFRDSFDNLIDRQALELASDGVAIADARVVPVFGTATRQAPAAAAVGALPEARLSIISEPDAFSDQVAARLPRNVGRVQLEYRGVEKGILLNALVQGNYDVVSIVIEATMHSPKFWTSFFEPTGSFVAFGTPIPEVGRLDATSPDIVPQLETILARDGNWILLLRERRLDAVQPWLEGLTYTPTGQDDLGEVTLRSR